jgi:thiosulfate reductase cytochrome b subunit
MRALEIVKKVIPWLLLALLALYIITGLGITEYRIIEKITFDGLSRNLSFKIHDNLLYPFLVVLVAHIVLRYALKKKRLPRN